MRALRKLPASTSAEGGSPAGRSRRRFSTEPSSATSTTRARAGSRRTNSTCLRRAFCLLVTTTPAPRDRPDRSEEACDSAVSRVWPEAAALHLCLDALALVDGEIADLEERVDEEAQADLRRQAPGAGMGRVDQPGMLQVRHDVAHGGGRQRHRQDAGDVARADRLAGRQIALDDAPEDLARALVQLREGAGLIGRSGFLGRPVHRWNVIGRYSWTRSGRNSGMRPHYVSGPGPRRKPSLAASGGND